MEDDMQAVTAALARGDFSLVSDSAAGRHKLMAHHVPRLAQIAHRAIHVRGLEPKAIVMNCIRVDSKWREIVDMLMPNYDWQQCRDRGEEPVAIGSALFGLCELLAELFPDLKDVLLADPAEGKVKAIALDDTGLTVYEIEPKNATN